MMFIIQFSQVTLENQGSERLPDLVALYFQTKGKIESI
jgi:hypothetical protein